MEQRSDITLQDIREILHAPEAAPKDWYLKDAAVLIPFTETEEGLSILFEKRSGTVSQPGEVCFPGGGVEAGEEPAEAALREIREELLLKEDAVELVGPLGLPAPGSYRRIWPFVGLLKDYHGTFDPAEVAETFTVPLRWFLENEPERYVTEYVPKHADDFPWDLVPGGRDYPWHGIKKETLFYRHPRALIWGLTAGITDRLIQRIRPL